MTTGALVYGRRGCPLYKLLVVRSADVYRALHAIGHALEVSATFNRSPESVTVADVPGADLHEYTESTRIPVVTYVAWADHLLRLMENLRPLPQHAPANQARFSTREVEFYNAVRAGIPEKMDGSHMRTDLSRQVIGIRTIELPRLDRI